MPRERKMFDAGSFTVANALKKAGYEVYVVGGAVRDFLMGTVPHDIDFATNATPEQTKTALGMVGIGTYNVGEKYGTIVANLNGEQYEITTYRKDGAYTDGRHPKEVTFGKTIEDDLSRRDFTMNAMALDLFTGEITDPYGGRRDIEDGVLRFVGDADRRVGEDALRILRGVRFLSKYGFCFDEEGKAAMLRKEHLSSLSKLSRERKTEELKKFLLSGGDLEKYLNEYKEVFFAVIPALKDMDGCEQNNPFHKTDVWRHTAEVVSLCDCKGHEREFEIRLAALLHDAGKPETKICVSDDGFDHFYGHPKASKAIAEKVFEKDLSLTNKEKDRVLFLIEKHDALVFQQHRSLRRCIAANGREKVGDLALLKDADGKAHIFPKEYDSSWYVDRRRMEEMLAEIDEEDAVFSLKDLAVNGRDLMELGYQGKEIGEKLREMLSFVVDGVFSNDKETLLSKFCDDKLGEQEEEKER